MTLPFMCRWVKTNKNTKVWIGGDRGTQNTLDSEFNLISKSLDTGPQTLRWSAGRFQMMMMPLCGPTCKLRLASWNSTSVEFQVGPSLAKNGLQNIWSKIIVSKKTLVQNLCVPKHYCVPKYFWVSQVLVWRGSDQWKLRYRTSNTDVVGWSAGRSVGRPAGSGQ